MPMPKTEKAFEAALTPEHKSVVKSVFIAMAMVKTLKPIVDGYHEAILAKHKWPFDEEHRDVEGAGPVLDIKSAFLLSDEHSAIYFEECDKEMEKAGLSVEKKGNCPLLEAEWTERNAKHLMIETFESITNISLDMVTGSLENYKKYVDIILGMMAKYTDAKLSV